MLKLEMNSLFVSAKTCNCQCNGLNEHASKENAKGMYELVKEERINESE